jgi:hypothetical protein
LIRNIEKAFYFIPQALVCAGRCGYI